MPGIFTRCGLGAACWLRDGFNLGKRRRGGSTPAVVPGAAPALAKAGVGGHYKTLRYVTLCYITLLYNKLYCIALYRIAYIHATYHTHTHTHQFSVHSAKTSQAVRWMFLLESGWPIFKIFSLAA